MDVTADDLLPLVAKLTWEERVRLSRLALLDTTGEARPSDSEAYRASPIQDAEFGDSEDPLAWEGEGWEGLA